MIPILEAVVAVVVPTVISVLAYLYLRRRWTPLLILVAYGITAFLVGPVGNNEFIDVKDVLDTSELHHDHIVLLLAVLGIVGALVAEILIRRASRKAGTPPPADATK